MHPFFRRSSALVSLCIPFALAGCAGTGPMEPAAPAHTATSAAPPVMPDSVIQIPLHLDLQPLAAYADAQLPKQQNDGWTDTGKHVLGEKIALDTAWSRDAIKIAATGDTISVDTTVFYRAKVGIGGDHHQLGQCGWDDPPPTLTVGLTLSLTPQPDWSLAPELQAPEPVIGKRCLLTQFEIDVSQKVADAVRKKFTDMAPGFETRFAEKLHFQAQGQAAWEALNRPYPLGQDGRYLDLHPRGASLSPLVPDPDGKGVSIVLGLRARPEILTSAPAATTVPPLPALEKNTGDGLFRLALPVEIPYAALDASLNQKYAGKTFPIAGNPETVDHVAVYASGLQLVIAVQLHGKADCTVYLAGLPAYDPANATLYLDKLDYTLDTQNVVAKSAGWLLHGKLQDMLQADARFDLSAKVAELKRTAESALNRPLGGTARLSGAVRDVGPQGFVLSDTGITAYLVASGKAELSLD